jgi:UDP-N-acetylglucosamine--N-acetylmuramyl-(pentapeptide) pyrophosphoryl-undecaprenol N-acetylglucosamine transferase
MEERIVRARGLKFAAIRAGKFRREYFAGRLTKVFNPQTLVPNTRDAFRTVAGVGDAIKVLRRFRPDVVFIKGGFVGVPVGLAARALRIPYVLHESDVTPGLANRFLGRWATKIGVGFPVRGYHDFDRTKLVYVGNPVRQEILKAHRLEGIGIFKLEEDLPVLLVTGGSQGARQINDVVVAALPQLLEFCQVVHQAGEGERERLKFEMGRTPRLERAGRYHLFGFILKDMGPALAAADILVGRAGVGTISDAAVLGKPLVLIPNAEMAGHQVANARVLSRAGAARVLDGHRLTPQAFVAEIKHLIDDPEEQKRLSEAIKAFGGPEAAQLMAEVVREVGASSIKQKPNMDPKEHEGVGEGKGESASAPTDGDGEGSDA